MTDKKSANKQVKQQAAKPADTEDQNQQSTAPAQNSDIEKLKKELEDMTELAKRTMADLHNYRRRQEEEKKSLFTMANATLIIQLLPVLDNLERAKQHVPESAKEWFKGIEMCISQLKQALQSAGLQPIVALGQTFNPDFHEALAQGPGEKDKVIEELEKGYMLGNRVLRHAKVKIGITP